MVRENGKLGNIIGRRMWRTLHFGVNEATGEIVTAVVSTNDVSDDQVFSDLLDGVEGEVRIVSSRNP